MATIVRIRTARVDRECKMKLSVCAGTIVAGARYRSIVVPPGDREVGNDRWWSTSTCGACAQEQGHTLPHAWTEHMKAVWLDDAGNGAAVCECGRRAPVRDWVMQEHLQLASHTYEPPEGGWHRATFDTGRPCAGLKPVVDRFRWLIWSHHHRLWWGPAGRGYYKILSWAGRYAHADTAEWLTRGCGDCSVPEVIIPDVPASLLGTPQLPDVLRGRIRLATMTARRTRPNRYFEGHNDRSRV